MENEQKSTIGLHSKGHEFKMKRIAAKNELTEGVAAIELEVDEFQLKQKADYLKFRQEANDRIKALKEQYNDKIAQCANEEDAFNIEFDAWRSRIENHIMPYYDEQGTPIGVRIRVKDMGMDFMIRLHDEFDGREVKFSEAEQLSLPDEKMVRVLGFYRKEVNALLENLGGDPLDGWYWTSTPAEDVFGALNANLQLLFDGTYGSLNYSIRLSSSQVRVALAL